MTDSALVPRMHSPWRPAVLATLMRVGFVLLLAYVVLFGGDSAARRCSDYAS